MSIPDELILRYFKLLTHLTQSQLKSIENQLNAGENPRNIKLELASTIVNQFHSSNDASKAKENFINVFSNHSIPNDIPEINLSTNDPIHLINFICDHQLAPSKKKPDASLNKAPSP